MKKILTVLLAVLSLVFLASCEKKTVATTTTAKPQTSSSTSKTTTSKTEATTAAWDVKSQEYDLLDYNSEYNLKTTKLNGYYFNEKFHAGNETLLYVDFDEFLQAMDGYLLYENYKFDKNDNVYNVYWTYENEDTHETEDLYLTIDLAEEKITYNQYFGYNLPEMEETDYSYSLYTDSDKSYDNEKYVAEYNFKNYDIDFFKYEGKYMVPYWVANYFLNTQNYCNVFFNEREFIFVYCDLSSLTAEQNAAVRNNPMSKRQPTKKEREDLMNQLSWIYENIFGVREDENDGKGYNTLLESLSYSTKKCLTATDSAKNNQGYKLFAYSDVHDLHTYLVHSSLFLFDDESGISRSDVSAYYLAHSEMRSTYKTLRQTAGHGEGYVRFYEDTAIITFDSFKTGETKELKDEDGNILDGAKDVDSFYMFRYCLEEIAKHSEVKNIVVDTTINGGGNVGAMIRVLGYMMEDIYNDDYYKNFDHKTSTCYHVDTNFDNECNASDVFSQYTWYNLCSEYSYSAANTFALICKNSGVKLIGQKTGGGMCSITPLCLVDGTSIYTSSENCTTFYTDKVEGGYTFVDVQNGVDVDIELAPENFYNDQAIYEAIHQ